MTHLNPLHMENNLGLGGDVDTGSIEKVPDTRNSDSVDIADDTNTTSKDILHRKTFSLCKPAIFLLDESIFFIIFG